MPLLARELPLHHSQPLHPATARLVPRSSLAGKPRRRVPASSRARVRVRASNSDPPQQQGADAASRVPLPEGSRQLFVMSENLSAAQKEDVAWASYVLLRNTNTTSVLIAIGDVFCVRGFWDPPANTSKYAIIEWFKSQMQQVGLVDLRDNLYFPNSSDGYQGVIILLKEWKTRSNSQQLFLMQLKL
ncbi:hypothetical protein PAHAL_9G410100 [Panicum hallii]|uniref:Uncharacterized protein n=1 Tax=Panicum hallii TaxID=206008 RepID=A0A2S3IPB0_9POAL|nr:hypothetical protein PAHAL_9G410100 [Panicum hallii]